MLRLPFLAPYSISEEGMNSFASSNTINSSRSVSGSYSDNEGTVTLGQISITARVVVSFELN